MAIRCEHVHRLELRMCFVLNYVAYLPVKREIMTKFNFRHLYPKVRNTGITDKRGFQHTC